MHCRARSESRLARAQSNGWAQLGFAELALCWSLSAGAGGLIFVDNFEAQQPAVNYALRFYGNGFDDIDRVKIPVDDPATDLPGPPIDVGIDFTLEFWMRAEPGENAAGAVSCGENNAWIYGNIILDRDRFNQGRAYGLSMANRRLVWGIDGEFGSTTICGSYAVDDGEWHHIAVSRREADGQMWIYVDGVLDAVGFGPTGDVSYPDSGKQIQSCGGLAEGSDPFLVIGAEKHDCSVESFPSFAGWLDELRVSDRLRYTGPFVPPNSAFVADANTVALFHMDESSGIVVRDGSGYPGGPSHGTLKFGGTPPGPERVASSAPTARVNR